MMWWPRAAALGFSAALLLGAPGRAAASNPCQKCHPGEAAGYTHSAMARSLRKAGNEPAGAFTTASGVRFTIRSDGRSTWQRREHGGEAAEYPVAYVIGSGS